MSGPITVVIAAEPISTLIAAAAIHAAEAVRAGYAEAAVLAETRSTVEAGNQAARREAAAAAHAERRAEAAQLMERASELLRMATRLGVSVPANACPPYPDGDDPSQLAAWCSATAALIAELETLLRTEAVRRGEELADADPTFVVPTSTAAQAPLSQRWLMRIAHLGEIPESIASLARELDETPQGERAELLASELRRRIQAHAGEVQRQAVHAATATIVEATLRDLGYQVDGIAETLFIEGGVAHFRRPGWGDYMVRLRAEAGATTVNFNVVRAADDANNAQSVLDHLAEDRWCAEFPALLRALEARGVRLTVTRRLEAGELPVQNVARERLPRFADEENRATVAPANAREIR